MFGYNFPMRTLSLKIFQNSPKLLAFFTTRENNNLAFHVDDDNSLVEIHHEVLACQSGYDKNSLVLMEQIHSNIVHIVTDEDFSSSPICDALITNKKDKPLMVMVADCAPILFYDPKQQVIAAAHAGRAGAFSNIIENVIKEIQESFSSKPKDILISMGAKIGVCCYEVGREIVEHAMDLELDYAIAFKEDKYYLDINAILLNQLLSSGIILENIEIDHRCSACHTDTFYSYRAEGKTGRFAGVIMLR